MMPRTLSVEACCHAIVGAKNAGAEISLFAPFFPTPDDHRRNFAPIAKRIATALHKLEQNPTPDGALKLAVLLNGDAGFFLSFRESLLAASESEAA